MADKKIVSAKDAKKGAYSKAVDKDSTELRSENRKKNAMKFRIPAIILWVLALGAEAAAVYMFNINQMTWLIVALVVDAVFVIIGSLLWKKANHVSPCTSKSKVVCFLQNQLGVIAALLAFIPFGIYFLKNSKNLSPKMKQIIAVLLGVLVIGSVGASIDYRPATPESVAQAEEAAAANGTFSGTVYWTQFGKSYHLDPDCSSLSRTTVLIQGTIEEAFEQKRFDPCNFCAGGDTAVPQAEFDDETVTDRIEDGAETEDATDASDSEDTSVTP